MKILRISGEGGQGGRQTGWAGGSGWGLGLGALGWPVSSFKWLAKLCSDTRGTLATGDQCRFWDFLPVGKFFLKNKGHRPKFYDIFVQDVLRSQIILFLFRRNFPTLLYFFSKDRYRHNRKTYVQSVSPRKRAAKIGSRFS